MKRNDDRYSDEEARKRFEKALRAGLNMPAKPHADMKLGKPRGKSKTRAKATANGRQTGASPSIDQATSASPRTRITVPTPTPSVREIRRSPVPLARSDRIAATFPASVSSRRLRPSVLPSARARIMLFFKGSGTPELSNSYPTPPFSN